MCKTISMNDYRLKKIEHSYFEFYTHTEQFFGEKKREVDLVKRMYLTAKYISDLVITIDKYIKTQQGTESLKRIVRAGGNWLKEIAEAMQNV